MLRRTAVVALLPLLAAAQPLPPPPVAEARGDLDGSGRSWRAHLERDGVLVVDKPDGTPALTLALAKKGPIAGGEVRIRSVEGHTVVHARADVGRGRAFETVLADAVTLPIYTGPTGPVGDGERAIKLRVDEDGVVLYQTAAGFSRCDGDDLLFPERFDFAGKRFRPVTDEPPAGMKLRATATAPSGLGGPSLGLFRFTAASTDSSGDRRADRLAAPRELEDGAPATVWHAGYGATARGAWVTARAQAGIPRVRALQIIAGKEAPKSLALLLGPSSDQQFTVELAPGAQWVTLPELLPTTCVTVAVVEPGAHDNTLAEVRVFTDVDGPGGLERLAGDVADMKPNADGAAHLLAGRGVEAARVVERVLPTSHGLGRRRLLQVLAAIGSDESAPVLGKALETAEPADRELLVGALAKMGAAGGKEAIRVYSDESQTAEARADAALVLGQLPRERAGIDALVAGAGKGAPPVREATMQSLARVYQEAGGAIERELVGGGREP
ncbi:MAG TPA: HEAT repeat domain-containing protein, partial [Polyangia bacterium]